MKKTPIQKALKQVNTLRKLDGIINPIGVFETILTKLLEEEKEQLIQAVYRGDEGESFYGSAGDLEGFLCERQDAEEWFERTYESNE